MSQAEHNRIITRAVVVSLLGIAAAFALYLVRDVLLTLYISALLAVGLSPAVVRIERQPLVFRRVRIPRWLAILSIYLGFLLAVGLVLALVLPPLSHQVGQLAEDLPGYVDHLQQQLVQRGLIRTKWSWSTLFTNSQVPGIAITGLFSAVTGAVGVFGKLVTVLLLPFYLLLEAASIRRGLLRLLKKEDRARADLIAQSATAKVGAWLGGQFLLAAVIGSTATLGFWLIGVPYFYVLGLVAAVGEMIPVVGPILASIPAILLGLTVSPQTALVVALYCWAQQFVENNFLVPRIMQRQVGVSPVTIFIALLVGSTLLGFAGAILAVPTAAILQVVIDEQVEHNDSLGEDADAVGEEDAKPE